MLIGCVALILIPGRVSASGYHKESGLYQSRAFELIVTVEEIIVETDAGLVSHRSLGFILKARKGWLLDQESHIVLENQTLYFKGDKTGRKRFKESETIKSPLTKSPYGLTFDLVIVGFEKATRSQKTTHEKLSIQWKGGSALLVTPVSQKDKEK
jgi:hypothetical protein